MAARVGILRIVIDTNDPVGTTYDGTITGFGDVVAFNGQAVVVDSDTVPFQGVAQFFYLGAANASGTFKNYSTGVYTSTGGGIAITDRGWDFTGSNKIKLDDIGEYTVTRVTDGLRLTADNYNGQLTDVKTELEFIVFSGCKAAVLADLTQNNTTEVYNFTAEDGSGSFDADAMFTLSSNIGLMTNQSGNGYNFSIGACQRLTDTTFNQYNYGSAYRHGVTTSEITGYLGDQVSVQVFNSALTWTAEITNWTKTGGANSFTLQTNGSTGGDAIAYLLIEDTIGFHVGSNTVSTSQGTQNLTGSTATGMTSKVVWMDTATSSALNTTETSGTAAGGRSYYYKVRDGFSNDTRLYGSAGAGLQDGVTTQNNATWKSTTSDTFSIKGRSTGFVTHSQGSVAWTNTAADVIFSQTNDTSVYGYYILSDTEALPSTGGVTIAQGLQDLSTGFIPSLSQIHSGLS
jgi:hypothetical protein